MHVQIMRNIYLLFLIRFCGHFCFFFFIDLSYQVRQRDKCLFVEFSTNCTFRNYARDNTR